MRRLLDFVLRNWPLKLAAIGLATVLYAGVTLSGNERTWPGSVPIEMLAPPPGAAVLDLPGSVTSIRYRAPIEAASQLTNGSFLASIDLGDVTPTAGGPPVAVPVRVSAVDPRVQIIDFTPRSVNVRVDTVVSRPMTVTVDRGTVPDGLTLERPRCSPPTVIVHGASSRVGAVQSVVARVAVDASGLNVDQDVDLEAIDETGATVPGVEAHPPARPREHRRRAGAGLCDPARDPGHHRCASARVSRGRCQRRPPDRDGERRVGRGRAAVLASRPCPWTSAGKTETLRRTVDADLPADVSLVGEPGIALGARIEPDQGSRTFQVGVQLQGARATRQYSLSTPTVLVTLSGSLPDLEALDPSTIDGACRGGQARSRGRTRWMW